MQKAIRLFGAKEISKDQTIVNVRVRGAVNAMTKELFFEIMASGFLNGLASLGWFLMIRPDMIFGSFQKKIKAWAIGADRQYKSAFHKFVLKIVVGCTYCNSVWVNIFTVPFFVNPIFIVYTASVSFLTINFCKRHVEDNNWRSDLQMGTVLAQSDGADRSKESDPGYGATNPL